MSKEGRRFPAEWRTATISDLSEFVTSGSRGWATHYSEDGPLFLRVGNLDHDTLALDLTDVQHVQPPEGAEGERTRVSPGDILLSITADVGMIGLAQTGLGEAYVNQHVALIRPLPSVYPPGLAYSLLDPQGLQAVARREQYGATKPGLSLDQVRGFDVPVPPLAEQHRIVAAVESYISRLDEAERALARVQRNVKRYRAAVLQAAVEGRLVPTEAALARAEGRDYEPASELLKRILAERRRRWEEAELARLKAAGKAPKDDNWQAKYEDPAYADVSALPRLPQGWCWATLDQLSVLVRNGFSKAPDSNAGVPILRISAVRPLAVDLRDIRYLPPPASKYADFLVGPGDLLFTRYNGTRSLVGVCGLVGDVSGPLVHPDKLIRVRLVPLIAPRYVEIATNTGASRMHLEHLIRTTAGQSGVSGTDLKRMPLALPPGAEQSRIEREASRLISVVGQSCLDADAAVARTSRLRQSILKWAFEGKLVDQDPNDEPATVLLERIRAEHGAEDPPPARRVRGKKARR